MSIFTSTENRYVKEMINKQFGIKCRIDPVHTSTVQIYFLDEIDIISTLRIYERTKMCEAHNEFIKMMTDRASFFTSFIWSLIVKTLKIDF